MTLADKWADALMTAKKAWDNAFLVNDRYIVPMTTEAIVEIAKAIMKGDGDGRKDTSDKTA